MGFLFVFIAVAFNMVKSYGSKSISKHTADISVAVDVSLLRNFLCALIGAAIVAVLGVDSFILPPIGLLICTTAGVAIGAGYVVWVLVLRTGVYVFANAANTASFIIPALCGLLFWKEALSLYQGLAILIILAAMLFMGRYQSEMSGKISFKHIVLLVLTFLTEGTSMATQKWFTEELPNVSVNVYTFYALLISVIILIIFSSLAPQTPKIGERVKRVKGLGVWIAVMAICFYVVTFFQTKASAMLGAVIAYPLNKGMALVCANIMAWLCFSEKPTKNSIVGMILVFSALMLARL